MSIRAKCLIEAKYAAVAVNLEYTATGRTIIDKFTATNNDASSRTITVHLCPSGVAPSTVNIITPAFSITNGVVVELTELKNQILEAGDSIQVFASVAGKVVIRASGREIT